MYGRIERLARAFQVSVSGKRVARLEVPVWLREGSHEWHEQDQAKS